MTELTHHEVVINLLEKHLGPIAPLDDEVESELIRRIIEVDYPNGKNIMAALVNMNISRRQQKPYSDALIMGRIVGLDGQELFDYIKETAVVHPGAIVHR